MSETAEKIELMKCPFCGGEGKLVDSHGITSTSWKQKRDGINIEFSEFKTEKLKYEVKCSSVFCNGRSTTGIEASKETAIKKWNTRAESKKDAILALIPNFPEARKEVEAIEGEITDYYYDLAYGVTPALFITYKTPGDEFTVRVRLTRAQSELVEACEEVLKILEQNPKYTARSYHNPCQILRQALKERGGE